MKVDSSCPEWFLRVFFFLSTCWSFSGGLSWQVLLREWRSHGMIESTNVLKRFGFPEGPWDWYIWYIYIHLVDLYGKCRWIYHFPWTLWFWNTPGKDFRIPATNLVRSLRRYVLCGHSRTQGSSQTYMTYINLHLALTCCVSWRFSLEITGHHVIPKYMFVMVGFHGGFHVSPFQIYLGHINLAAGCVSWFKWGIFRINKSLNHRRWMMNPHLIWTCSSRSLFGVLGDCSVRWYRFLDCSSFSTKYTPTYCLNSIFISYVWCWYIVCIYPLI